MSKPIERPREVRESILELVQEAIGACRQREQSARRERQQWERVLKLIPDIERRPFAVVQALDALEKRVGQAGDLLVRLRGFTEGLVQEQLTRYTELLRQSLPPDVRLEGRLSEGYRVQHVIRVRIDEQRRRASIETISRSRQIVGDISVETVADVIRGELQRLFERPFDPKRFGQDLLASYELALAVNRRPGRMGEPVLLFDVHRFLVLQQQEPRALRNGVAASFKPYPLDEFAVDLGRLLASGEVQIDRWHLHLHPVRNPTDGVFIVNFDAGIGQNFGLISFAPCNER